MLNNSAVRAIGTLVLGLVCLSGCDGGKENASNCGGNGQSSSPYVECNTDPKPCPSGQQKIDGVCQVPRGDCPSGQHRQDGQCVPDGLTCEEGQHLEGGLCVADQLTIEIVSESVCRKRLNGATRIILQFITRGENGLALDPAIDANKEPTALTSQLYVDGRPADVESLLNRDSELLRSNLAISLVLDATFSMLQHNPPAFEPMKVAAMNVLQELQEAWAANNSQFHWELSWFDELIFRPAPNNRGALWSIGDIAKIPSPTQGHFTGLWKAMHYGIGVHENLLGENIASGARDQQVMVVFSDGDDNHSFFANDDEAHSGSGNLDNVLFWNYAGYPKTSVEEVKTRLMANPKLRVYVIAFGSNIGEQGRMRLQELAELSHGQYFSGSANLEQLFDSVKREFITMQTLGIETSLDFGEYELSLRTEHLASGAEGRKDFAVQVSDQMPECPNQ